MTLATRTRESWATRAFVAAVATAGLLAPALPARAGTSEVLLRPTSMSMSELAAAVSRSGGSVLADLEIAETLLVELPTGVVPAGATVVPNVALQVNSLATPASGYSAAATPITTYRDTIGAGAATGRGVTVALVDTGVANVPDLSLVDHVNVSGAAQGDGFGHGTFLAGLIAGNGQLKGVAPSAKILDVQVADQAGNTSLGQVLRGLQAVADRPAVKVLVISLSTGSPLPPQFDPLSVALDRLWGRGVTVVTAAGNNGPSNRTVTAPGNDPVLLTVGASAENGTSDPSDDTVADFSSRGTTHLGSKPDLVAPGVSVVSTRAPGSIAVLANPASLIGDYYFRGTGTSMSTAIAAGAVAAVLAVNPGLTPGKIKGLLTDTAVRSQAIRPSTGGGAGLLNLAAAMAKAQAATTSTAVDSDEAVEDDWGPEESEQANWGAFAKAWEAGDYAAVKVAWAKLSWRTQQWAARAWAMAVAINALGSDSSALESKSQAARSWTLDYWLAQSWAARSAAEQDLTYDEWLARSWAARSWAARSWAARSWAVDDWLARSWAARSWASSDWAARSWAARSWAARSWAARSWAEFIWTARSWAAGSWSARSWAMTE
ncbi:MAG: S8 family serine peptidase [Candidatus Nanopelagicales bacterium]